MQRTFGVAKSLRAAGSGVQNAVKNSFGEATAAPEGITNAFGVRHVSRQILQQRMKSVGNIEKITSAMKMVAASRLRGAQARAEQARGCWQPMVRLLGDSPDNNGKSEVIVSITSDRGLCGGINSNIAKNTRGAFAITDMLGNEAGKETKLVMVGDKAKSLLAREYGAVTAGCYTDYTKQPPTFLTASLLADDISKTDFDVARIFYNKFKSAISFVPTMVTVQSFKYMEGREGFIEEYEFEDEDRTQTLTNLAEFQLACTIYNGMIENVCSELGSRMSAMDSSTKNAKEMKEKLTLMFNRSRQAAITTELIEIISGASALEG